MPAGPAAPVAPASTAQAAPPPEVLSGIVTITGHDGAGTGFICSFRVEITHKAHVLGATALVGMQLVQSQFQWNQRTSLLATAIRLAGAELGSVAPG